VIGELASNELGRAMLHVQALQEESLVAILLQRIPQAVRPWGRFGRGSQDLQAQLNIGVDLGLVSGRPTVERGHNEVHRSCSIPGTECATRSSLSFGRIMLTRRKLVCSGHGSAIAEPGVGRGPDRGVGVVARIAAVMRWWSRLFRFR
jgi:hypothetical protein